MEWYSEVEFNNTVYSITKEIFNQWKSIKIYASELWGDDYISFNRYETIRDNYLRPCEISEQKVLQFLNTITPHTPKTMNTIQSDILLANTLIIWLGCFRWVQAAVDKLSGIIATEVWYAWGILESPNYEKIGDYTEAVKIIYDPSMISLQSLLNFVVTYKDPTFQSTKNQYKYAVWYINNEQKILLQQIIQREQQKHERPIRIQALPHTHFERAEEYHQQYFKKNNKWI